MTGPHPLHPSSFPLPHLFSLHTAEQHPLPPPLAGQAQVLAGHETYNRKTMPHCVKKKKPSRKQAKASYDRLPTPLLCLHKRSHQPVRLGRQNLYPSLRTNLSFPVDISSNQACLLSKRMSPNSLVYSQASSTARPLRRRIIPGVFSLGPLGRELALRLLRCVGRLLIRHARVHSIHGLLSLV